MAYLYWDDINLRRLLSDIFDVDNIFEKDIYIYIIYFNISIWYIIYWVRRDLYMTLMKIAATEIRCQEKSKGGLCYEVILAEPTVPKRAPSPPQTTPTQQTAIEDKLRAAEERRLSLEAHKLAALASKLSKIEEASRKKDELSAAFIAATRESLDAKMNNTEEKREAHIAELKSKLKEHVSREI